MKNSIISKVFLWMTAGLLITFATGYVVALNEKMLINIFASGFYWIFILAELILVLVLSARVLKMKKTTAQICFILYSFVSGLTFSSVFVIYDLMSIFYVFIIAAIIFALFGAIGYFTDIDLSKWGTFLLMSLFGIILCMVMNMFLKSEGFDLTISIISIIVFLGFTAYDLQKLKYLSESEIPEDNLAIYGALELYLDYINIFLDLLRIFGDSKD